MEEKNSGIGAPLDQLFQHYAEVWFIIVRVSLFY
jgi:hypothetical protein